MKIIPAIDIRNGNCVRLIKGDFTKETIYSSDPIQIAKKWEKFGFKKIHIVDLDGAKEGIMKNKKLIKQIVRNVNIPIQIGGGIRDEKSIYELLEMGIEKIVLGTRAITDREWLATIVKKYNDKIIVSLDEKNEFLAINGWENSSKIPVSIFVDFLITLGIKKIVYTDVSRDGTLSKPNYLKYKKLSNKISIIASGGITSILDIKKLSSYGISEVIIGKALYENKINNKEIKKYVG